MDFNGRAYNTRNGRYLAPSPFSPSESNQYRFQNNMPGANGAITKASSLQERIDQEDRLNVDESWWKPNVYVSHIPVVGSAWSSAYHFRQGEIGMGLLNAGFAAVDVGLLIASIPTGGGAAVAGTAVKATIMSAIRAGFSSVARQTVSILTSSAFKSFALQQGAKAFVGAGTGLLQGYASGRSGAALGADAFGGALGGVLDPTYATYGRAAGTVIGMGVGAGVDTLRGSDDATGVQIGMHVGAMIGGLAGAFQHGWQNAQSCTDAAVTAWQRGMAGTKVAGWNLGGMTVGGAVGYMVDGFDGMMMGANIGMMSANAALMFSPRLQKMLMQACFSGDTKLMARGPWGQGYRRIDAITLADEVLSRDEDNSNSAVE